MYDDGEVASPRSTAAALVAIRSSESVTEIRPVISLHPRGSVRR